MKIRALEKGHTPVIRKDLLRDVIPTAQNRHPSGTSGKLLNAAWFPT